MRQSIEIQKINLNPEDSFEEVKSQIRRIFSNLLSNYAENKMTDGGKSRRKQVIELLNLINKASSVQEFDVLLGNVLNPIKELINEAYNEKKPGLTLFAKDRGTKMLNQIYSQVMSVYHALLNYQESKLNLEKQNTYCLNKFDEKKKTVVDLSRIGDEGNRSYYVNGQSLDEVIVSENGLQEFFKTNGVQDEQMQDYLMKYLNQDGLFSIFHTYPALINLKCGDAFALEPEFKINVTDLSTLTLAQLHKMILNSKDEYDDFNTKLTLTEKELTALGEKFPILFDLYVQLHDMRVEDAQKEFQAAYNEPIFPEIKEVRINSTYIGNMMDTTTGMYISSITINSNLTLEKRDNKIVITNYRSHLSHSTTDNFEKDLKDYIETKNSNFYLGIETDELINFLKELVKTQPYEIESKHDGGEYNPKPGR